MSLRLRGEPSTTLMGTSGRQRRTTEMSSVRTVAAEETRAGGGLEGAERWADCGLVVRRSRPYEGSSTGWVDGAADGATDRAESAWA